MPVTKELPPTSKGTTAQRTHEQRNVVLAIQAKQPQAFSNLSDLYMKS